MSKPCVSIYIGFLFDIIECDNERDGGEMHKKAATVNFFRINSKQVDKVKSLIIKMEHIYDLFIKRKYSEIPTLKINDEMYYIQAMSKRTQEQRYNQNYLYYWLITISRVNMNEQLAVADISKHIDERRRNIEHSDSEGPVVDTRIIFDPFRSVIAIYSQRGTINTADLKRFMCKLVNKRGIMFEIILNKSGYERLDRLDLIDEVTYKVSSPEKFKSFVNENRSELADLQFAKKMSTDEMYITLKSSGLSKTAIKNKIKSLLSNDKIKVESMKIDGLNDGVRDPIDLIKNKLIYKGYLEFEDYVDDEAVYALLNKAYDNNEEYLSSLYKISEYESEFKNYEQGENS